MKIRVDIDDTICFHPDTSQGPKDYSLSQPWPDRIARVNTLYDRGDTITYWTARGTVTGICWREVTKRQLHEWGCKYHALEMGKPAYDLFIDDKNINSETFFNLNEESV